MKHKFITIYFENGEKLTIKDVESINKSSNASIYIKSKSDGESYFFYDKMLGYSESELEY